MAEKFGGKSTPAYRLSSQDASFIYADTNNGPLHLGSIAIFEGKVDFQALLAHVEERLHLVPRYRQRLVEVPFNLAHPIMEDDPDFSYDHHVFRHQLPGRITEGEAFEEILQTYEVPLNRKHPLWEMHSFENLVGNRTAILWKVHHCLVDGVSGVELLKVMYDFRAEPVDIPQPAEPWTPARPTSPVRRFGEALRDRISSVANAAINAAVELAEEPAVAIDRVRMASEAVRLIRELSSRSLVSTPWNAAPVTQERVLAWSKQPFSDFRAIRAAFGGSINDVVLTMLTEGAARYLKDRGYDVEGEEMCVGCPVNVRHKEEQTSLGNRVSMMFPVVPAEPMDVVERLKLIREETERIKAHGSAQAIEVLMSMASEMEPSLIAAGTSVTRAAIDAGGALMKWTGWRPRPGGLGLSPFGINFIATNVPGVQIPLYLNGHMCLDMVPLVPLGATLGFGVAILSYRQSLYFGMMAAPCVMPDVAQMKQFAEEAFADLKRRATKHTAHVVHPPEALKAAGR
ncbi:MAG TPA: wax ester/triacylglycerol synthase family O-acyltransferase [Candidatus Binataceae bacterium]|nr:wax ester/triacylglycerol synthase family O-acyltransferase [Candidatus Binataceae bacterium]